MVILPFGLIVLVVLDRTDSKAALESTVCTVRRPHKVNGSILSWIYDTLAVDDMRGELIETY